MRELAPAPHQLIDVSKPVFGSFRGALPKLDLGSTGRSKLWDFVHEKRWVYAGIADKDVYVSVALVSLGYAANAIVFVSDRRTGRMLFDQSFLAPPTALRLYDEGGGARGGVFRSGPARLSVSDAEVTLDVRGKQPLYVHAKAGRSLEPIGAVVPIEGGFANATEKRVAEAEGEVVAEGMRFVLDRPLIAHDHTHGFLARHTAWRWALGLGRTEDDEILAFNLVEGFVGEPECFAWIGDELVALGEGRFSFDSPLSAWTIKTTCGALDVTFHPTGMHDEHKNLGIVRSEFIQPVGSYEGRLRRPDGRVVSFTRIAGVAEHQDVVW